MRVFMFHVIDIFKKPIFFYERNGIFNIYIYMYSFFTQKIGVIYTKQLSLTDCRQFLISGRRWPLVAVSEICRLVCIYLCASLIFTNTLYTS